MVAMFDIVRYLPATFIFLLSRVISKATATSNIGCESCDCGRLNEVDTISAIDSLADL